MKRFLTLMICLSCLISLASCSSHPFPNTKEGEYPQKCIRAEMRSSNVEITVGETFDKFLIFIPWPSIKHIDESIEHIDIEITVDRPDVVEIVSYDVAELLNHGEDDGLTVKGLKPGVATITMACIYKPTGGKYTSPNVCTVTVVDPNAPHQDETTASETEEETEDHAMDCETETEASTGIPDVELYESYRGEYNDLHIVDYPAQENGGLPSELLYMDSGCPVYRLKQGITFDAFHIFASYSSPDFKPSDFQAEVSVLEPDILEITDVKSELIVVGDASLGGITVKALSPGVAHVFIKVTHIPTGGSDTLQVIVIVRDPSETAE